MSKQQKQAYLTTQIIHKGYDCDQFIQFLTQIVLKNNQDADLQKEIQQLSLIQLQGIVQQFINTKKIHVTQLDQFDDYQSSDPPTIHVQHLDFDWGLLAIKSHQHKLNTTTQSKSNKVITKQSQTTIKKQIPITTSIIDLSPEIKSTSDNSKSNTNEQTTSINPTAAEKIFQEALKFDNTTRTIIPCLKLQQNILQHHLNIRFTIIDMSIQEKDKTSYKNIFKNAGNIIYTIKTEGRNKNNAVGICWTVKRKYSDFEWLRNILIKFYPGLIIPPIPKQPLMEDDLSKKSAKNKFEYFLKEIYKQKQLRSSKYFQIFLSYINYSDFQNEKKKGDQLSKPRALNHILNNVGQVQCNFNMGLNSYTSLIGQFIMNSSSSLRKVRQICKQIGVIYDSLAIKFEQFSDVCKQLKQCSDQLSTGNRKQIKCFQKLSGAYQYITNLVHQHALMAINEKQNINNFFTDYFAYEKVKVQNLASLIEKRNQFASEYEKASYNPSSGSGLFSKFSSKVFGDKVEYIDKPSSNFQTLKNQFGFFNNQLLKQTLKFVQYQVSSYIEHFTSYGDSRINSIDQMQSFWSRTMVNVSKLNVDTYF